MTRMLREARGWTQEHLAVVSGVHVRTIQRVEAGGSASAETLGALAAAFNVAATDVGGPVHVVPVREWEQDVLFPDDGAVYRSWETSERQVCAPMPVGPVKVKRFRFEFPVGEQPCLIVERKVGRMVVSEDGPREVWKPRRVMFPTFTEADLEEGETFEGRLRGVVAAFNNAGFDDAEAGTAGLRQVTWATMVVTGEPEQHSMAATHFAFGAGDLRFIASLKVIPHTLASLA